MPIYKLKDLKPDPNNFNKHTDTGMSLLEKSVDEVGVIESITVSNDNQIISGNARHEVISRKLAKEPITIETDGTTPIIIKRTDIESGSAEFTKAAILANTVSVKNIDLDLSKIEEYAVTEMGIDVEELGVELVKEQASDPFNDAGIEAKNKLGVIVMCESEAEQEEVFSRLTDEGYNCKIVVT